MKKRGKEVTGVLYTPSNATISAKGAIGTINSAYRPINSFVTAIVSSSVAYNGLAWFNGTNGIISVTNEINGTCVLSFYYLTA